MTIGTTFRNDAIGNDTLTTYPYGFKIFAATHLIVTVRLISTGVETELTYPTHYTVTGVGTTNGGNVVLTDVDGAWQNAVDGTLKTGYAIAIRRVVPVRQNTDVRNQGGFFADVHEDAFDYLTMILQQHEDMFDRSLTLPDSFDPTTFDMRLPVPSAGMAIGWNVTEDGLTNLVSLGSVGVSAYMETVLDDANAAAARTTLDVPSNSEAILDTIIDAKGDMIVGTAADTPAKFTVGANGAVPMARSAATAGLAYVAALNKAIYGLTYANNGSDATNDIDIATGGAMDATGAYWMTLASALTKQSDAAWAVGTNAGWLDTGAIGNSDYYIWLIARSDTGVVDSLCSLSSTAPTMPANYDFKRLIGWFKRVGGAIVAFTTYETEGGGLELMWTAPTLDINLANTLTTSRRTDAVKVPLNFSTIAHLNVLINDTDINSFGWVYCPDHADLAPSATAAPLLNLKNNANTNVGQQMKIRTSSAGLIAARYSVATADLYAVSTMGFEWGRRN